MEYKYNSLKTGETYKLIDLFSKDNKIIIPDLQRDYCWGTTSDKDGKNLVESFVENLITNKDENFNLGLLYGYEAPLGHIQLCDGQQRITTLFLLLGMLNKKTSNDAFRNLLVSKTEESDDWEPYLQYAIRESSLYFLSDLTRFFFIENKELAVSDIKKQTWYFHDYDFDPSIQSMIAAMSIIESKILDIDSCENFGRHASENLTFLYYDMGNRSKGEETFVVINTTGEPLSATENLKPLLINKQPQENQKYSAERWEKWEQFFWKNKGGNDTSDNGMKEFFRWIMLLRLDTDSEEFKSIQNDGTYKFDVKTDFEEIDAYYTILSEKLFPEDEKKAFFPHNRKWLSPGTRGNDQIVWFRILPVLEYIKRHPGAKDREVWRVRMLFKMLAKIQNIEKNISKNLPEAIRIIKNLPDADICSVLGLEETLLPKEMRYKLEVCANSSLIREEIEEAFWAAEDHSYTQGSINCIWFDLFNSSSKTSWNNDILNVFKQRFDIFNTIFSKENTTIRLSCPPEKGKIDNAFIARSLLAVYGDYSYCIGGNKWCYGYGKYWEDVISNKPEAISKMIDKLRGADDLYAEMESLIDEYVGRFALDEKERNSMYYVVKYPNSLQSLNDGYNILLFYNDDWNYWVNVLNKERASSYNINIFVYLVYKQSDDKSMLKNQWLCMNNGLQLDCAQNHGWIIKKTDKSPFPKDLSEKIYQKLSLNYNVIPNDEKRLLYIQIDTKYDLIEEGVKIIKAICDI